MKILVIEDEPKTGEYLRKASPSHLSLSILRRLDGMACTTQSTGTTIWSFLMSCCPA
jgi:DNA-binding response OmpR family regulator